MNPAKITSEWYIEPLAQCSGTAQQAMQHIVSFLISRVAKIADVAPSNVESSLSERTVCLRNLTLRTDTVNSMSGLRISSGRIEELHFQLPLPTSTTPLVIRPVGVTIVLSDLSPQGKNTEMTPDAIRRGITTESIIGMTECATPPRGAAMRKDESAHGPTVVGSRGEEESTGIGSDWENSDDDYFSCHSGTEITTSCQETVADGNTNLQGGGGVFSFLKSVANISVSWLFNRATLVHATNITLVFLSSVSDSFRLELEVREIIAQVEPLQQMNSDRIRVGRGTLSTVTLCACTNESRTNIITADNLTICVTMVYNLLGVLCRQNTAVTCQEGVSLFVNPTALRSLTSCMANYRRATEFPEYSRPFAHLRHARWKFAKCCVVELLRDRRRRYNFSLQHLHFYREARQWYLKLLEDCHLTGDVAGRIDELVEAERDLRYHDVVTFLRQKARQWYSGFTVADDVGLDSASQPTRTSTVMSSVHVNLREICVQTLPNMQLRVVDIEFVSRVKEVSVGIGNVLVVCSGITESLCVPAGRSGVLFYFRLLEKGTTVSLQVKLRPVKVSLTTEEGLGALRSVAEVAPPLLREVLYCNVGSSTTSSCVPAAATTPRTRAVAITAPLIQLQLDQIFFTCENLFLTWRFAEDASRSRFSCSFSDLSLCFGTGGEAVFAPVCARSARGHAVSVSIVKATCSIRLWNYLKQVWGTWRSVWFDLMEAINVVDQAQQGMVGVAAGVTMENVRWVATAQKEFRRNWESQQITVAGVVFKFEPLNMEIHIGRIGAFPSERWSGGTAAHISIESIYLISEEDNGTVVSLEIPCMAHCVITGASSDASTGTRCFLVSAGSLKVTQKKPLLQPLLVTTAFQLTCCGDLLHGSTDSMNLLNAVEVAPLRFLHRKSNAEPPTSCRPYIASWSQICMGVSSVHLDRLTNVQVSSVLGLVERFYMIVTDEVLPDEARRLFLSGLSNIAISLCPSPCVVTYHGTEALLCRLSMPLKDGPECAPLLDEFGVILPDMKDLPWLALIHNTQTLILTLHLPLLVAEVCHHKKPSVYLRGTIRSFRSELPMRRHEFWEIVDAARDTPSSIVCSSQLIALDCCGFVTQLMESVKFWHITQPRGTQDEGSGDFEAARDAFAPGAAVTTRLEFGSFTLRSTTFPHPSLLEGMAAVHRLFELFSPRHVFTSECIRDEEVDMDAAGSVFFDCPGRVVSVENCTFISTRVGGQIIICKDTYVYFKNTLFSHALLGAIVGEDESAFFVCVDCKEIEAFEESNSQNASLGECPAQKEVYSEKQKLIVVSIHRVKCELELTTGRQLAFELPLGEMRIAIESNEIKFSAHLQHGLCAFFNGDESCPVILDTETHAEAVLIGKNEEVVVAVTFQVGGVVIPFHLVQALHDVVLRWNYVPSVTGTNPFLSYGTHRSVKSLFKWEVFLAVSTLPVTLCLPGGVTFAKMTLISSVFRSKGDSEESARVEVRVGVEELFMWEFTMHAFAPVIKQPLTVAVTAQSTGFVNFSCEVNISAVDLCVSTEQIHSTLSLLSGLRAGSTTATKTHSSRLVNLLGLPVCLDHTMEDGQEQRVLVDSQPASWQATLVSPQNVSTAGEWKVRDLCRVVQGIGEPPNTDLFTTVDMATLSNGEKIQITSCVSRYTLSQHVTLRTVFHIVNQLPCYAVLSSNMAGAAMVVACPGETSCIPLSLFDCRNILLSLVREDGTNESNKEPLCKEESPREILKMAETRGDDSIGRLKLFEFSGDKAYVDVTYRLQGSFLTMFLAPAWPSIRNGIRFALKVRLLRNGMCVEEALVNPNDVFVTLRHDPHGPRVEYFFECAVYSQLYISSYPVDVRFIDPVAGESVVMKHKEFPCRYFFELSIEQHIHDVPSDSPAYVIKPRHVFGLENNSHTDVRITSEAGDSVGSLGGGVLACEPGRNFAYLPFHTPLTVHALSASPHVFKVGKSLEDRILQSALVDVAEDATVMHCLLLRSRNQGVDRFMELLPPLVVVNLNTRCDVVVSHSVKGKVSAKDEWCRRFTVPAGRALPCTILSSDEYTDYLAFAWTGNQGDEAGGVERDGNGAISIDVGSVSTALCDTNYFDRRNDDTNKKTRTVACPETCFSVPLEVLLLPKTNWSGFVQCGSTHHVVCIRKEGLYDTAIVTISAPRTPYVTLVNLTPNAYGALPPMTVLGITPPSVNSDELTLMNATNDEKESKLRISIDWDSDVDIGNGVTAALRCHRDGATVVFTQRELNSMCSLQSGKWTSRNSPQGSGHMKDSPGKNDTVVRLDVKFSRFSLFVRDVADTPLHLAFDSCSLWAVYQKMKITTQCTVSNIQSKGTYQGNKSHEVKPFCLDMTVRDIRFKGKTLSALSTHVNVSPLDMELSDVFAYQIQQLGKLFRTSLPAMDSGSTDVASMMAEVAQMNANPLGGLKLHLGLLLLFDIRAVLSYDRSVSPPEDVLFSGSPIGGIIPSIHQATVSLPKLQFHNLSGNSVVEVWSILSEKLASEFLKQVPQMLSSVVLFPSIFPVRRTLARIGSFIFGTETSDPEVQDTLLI